MTDSFLDDGYAPTDTKEDHRRRDLDAEPTGLIHQPVPGHMAAMISVARSAGERDRDRLKRLARSEGKNLRSSAYYRLPFRTKNKQTGEWETQYKEGASVALSDALRTIWGDIAVKVAHWDLHDGQLSLVLQVVDMRTGNIEERPHFYTLSKPPAAFQKSEEQKSRWLAMQMQSAVSKASRTTVLHVIPKWMVDAAMWAAKEAAMVEATPERIEKAIKWWAEMGVSVERLSATLKKDVENWGSHELTLLRDYGRSIRDGQVKVDDVIPPAPDREAGHTSQPTGTAALGGRTKPKEPPAATRSPSPITATPRAVIKTQLEQVVSDLGEHAAVELRQLELELPVQSWSHSDKTLARFLGQLQARLQEIRTGRTSLDRQSGPDLGARVLELEQRFPRVAEELRAENGLPEVGAVPAARLEAYAAELEKACEGRTAEE
jgi:hypothetical protein